MNLPEYKLVGGPYKLACHHKPSRNYYQAYRLPPNPKLFKAPCCTDKLQSSRKAESYVKTHMAKLLVRTDPLVAAHAATIEEHLAVYAESLRADGKAERYVTGILGKVRRINRELGWTRIEHIDGLRLKSLLAKWRKGSEKQRKLSVTTTSYYLAYYKTFLRFLCRHNRIESNPLAFTVESAKADPKDKRKRRSLTEEEFGRLLTAAKEGEVAFGLTGESRVMLYILSSCSGFRCQELASLTVRSFNLDDSPPSVVLDADKAKNRKVAVQILPAAVAGLFRDWLVGRSPDEPVWPTTGTPWWAEGADMLRRDLKRASIPYITAAGVADLHAIGRVQYITRLVGTGASVPMVMRLGRLSTPRLLESYFKPNTDDKVAVIDALPAIAVPALG